MRKRCKIQDVRFKNISFKKTLRLPVYASPCKRGFTLIELIIYMGIFSTLLMVLVQLFGSIVNVNLESEAISAVSQDGRYILGQMTYTLRQAKTFTSPAVGTTNSGPQLSFSTGSTTYTYSLSTDPVGQQNLLVSDGSTTERLNSYGTTVSGLSFTRLQTTGTTGVYTVTVSFTLTSTTIRSNGTKQETFQTTVGGRE